MGKIDSIVLDKTGTLTAGDFSVVDVALLTAPGISKDSLATEDLAALAGLELTSEHLLGRAVVQYASERGVRPAEVEDVAIRKGEGVTALSRGRRYFIGNLKLASAMGCEAEHGARSLAEEWQRAGRTVAFFGHDRIVRGMIAFGDRIKPSAQQLIAALSRRGVETRIVSGDATATTAAVAAGIGVSDFRGEVSSEGKAALIEEMKRAGKRVAMIGDGVNDAPALASADLGMALGTGAEIAMSAAPIVLMSGSLEKIEETFELAGKVTRIIRQNLFWAFFYNSAGIALAVSGLLNPIMAAGAMLLSSASVIANSMRISRLHPARRPHSHSGWSGHQEPLG